MKTMGRVRIGVACVLSALAFVSQTEGKVWTITSPYDSSIETLSRHYGIEPALVKAIIRVESNFNPYAISPAGARGLMQLMPQTARRLGVRQIFDPWENLRGGISYLRYLAELFENNYSLMLAAYNAGEGRVRQAGYRIPPVAETRRYVPTVLRHYLRYRALESPQRNILPPTGEPRPLITAVLGSGEAAEVDKPFYIKVVGVNAGGYAPAGGITVSFPDHPAARAGCQTDARGECTIYLRKAAIAVRPDQELRPAAYPLIESWYQGWQSGETHLLEIKLIPQQRGILRLFVRMALRRPFGPTYVGYPIASPVKDQQQWEVESYVIPIY